MRRLTVLLALAGLAIWGVSSALSQAEDEWSLPPVKLRPDRPTEAEPIPPSPDNRPAPAPVPEPAPMPELVPAPEPVAVTTPAEPAAAPEVPPAPPAALAPKTPKPEEIQAEAVEAQIEPEPAMDFTGMEELGLVEEVTRLRKAYGRALVALKDYYLTRGAQHKIEWIDQELKAFEAVPKTRYLTIAEVVGPDLKPAKRIPAADQLYTEGLDYKDYPAFPPAKKDYLKNALDKFQAIIEKYPQSDKIDDAAFRMGEIYGGWYFEDWARAVQCYERCWQWDPETQYAARFNAAKIYEERLKNRIKAVELYNAVLLKSKNPDEVNQARERIRALTGK